MRHNPSSLHIQRMRFGETKMDYLVCSKFKKAADATQALSLLRTPLESARLDAWARQNVQVFGRYKHSRT